MDGNLSSSSIANTESDMSDSISSVLSDTLPIREPVVFTLSDEGTVVANDDIDA